VLCDHIHLPVQSGSSRILKEMLRTYSRDEYLEKINWIRSARRPISLTTDIIVGFPGETETDFADTISLLEEVRYDGVFAFKYSPRPNTSAKDMPDAMSEEEKGRRLAVIQQHQREIQTARNQALLNNRFEVLVDGHHESRGQWSGRTTCNRIVNFTSSEQNLLGQYRCVQITAAGPNSLVGVQVE